MMYLGDYPVNHTAVCIPFSSFASASGASAATSSFVAGDVKIYKDLGTTERTSSNGITVAADFDGRVGINSIKIDLSDNTDAGFYVAGHEYQVVVDTVTIDTQTVRFVAGCFSIERAGSILALLKATGSVKVDVNKWAGTAVTVGSAGYPDMNVAKILNADPSDDTTIMSGTAAAVWDELQASHTIAGSTSVVLGARASQTSVDAIAGYVDTEVAAIKAKTDQLTFTVGNQIDANVLDWKSATAPAMTGDAFARLGAPVGASISADIAATPTALLDKADGIETGFTFRQVMRLMAAVMMGKSSGFGSASATFRNLLDTKNRVVASKSGTDRITVTYDAT